VTSQETGLERLRCGPRAKKHGQHRAGETSVRDLTNGLTAVQYGDAIPREKEVERFPGAHSRHAGEKFLFFLCIEPARSLAIFRKTVAPGIAGLFAIDIMLEPDRQQLGLR
jgi:hypothetical protein